MDSSAKAELASIKSELNSIIRELDDISDGVRNSFVGVGNDLCANCIDRMTAQVTRARNILNNLDTTTVTASYAAQHADD